jgi:transposase-like protein
MELFVFIGIVAVIIIACKAEDVLNAYKGAFLHCNDSSHFAVERYDGMFVTGYVCRQCHYKWYINKKSGEKV